MKERKEMKSAEQWEKEIDFCNKEATIKALKQIQRDAWVQGMTDAEKIVRENPQPCLDILRARDKWTLKDT